MLKSGKHSSELQLGLYDELSVASEAGRFEAKMRTNITVSHFMSWTNI